MRRYEEAMLSRTVMCAKRADETERLERMHIIWNAKLSRILVCAACADETGRRLLTERVPDASDAKVAVFYSISSTQPGLSGIDLGNFLIKQARARARCSSPALLLHGQVAPALCLTVSCHTGLPHVRTWYSYKLKEAH